jgi:hypothetical protein
MIEESTFLVVAPPYNDKSAGIVVLHDLCESLNKNGFKAGIIYITSGSQMEQNFGFAYSSDKQLQKPLGLYFDYVTGKNEVEIIYYIKNSIIIYPDIVKGNPLSSDRYATFVLGFPRFEVISKFIIRYAKMYCDFANFDLYKPCAAEQILASTGVHWTARHLSLTYIGKGSQYLECYRIPGTLSMDRGYPPDKDQLAILLSNCRYFYTWDCVSATNLDAILCGAVPVFLHEKQISFNLINSSALGDLTTITYDESFENVSFARAAEIDQKLMSVRANFQYHLSAFDKQVLILAQDLLECPYDREYKSRPLFFH